MITTKARDLAKEFKNPELSQEEENAIYGRLMRELYKCNVTFEEFSELLGDIEFLVVTKEYYDFHFRPVSTEWGSVRRGKNKPKICIHCNKEIDGSYAHIVNPAYGADWYLHWTECVSEFLAALPVEDHVEQDNLQAKEPK